MSAKLHRLAPGHRMFRTAKAERIKYQIRNVPSRLRAIPQLGIVVLAKYAHVPLMVSELRAVVHREGMDIDLGVISRRVVTTAGVNYLASTFLNTAEPENLNWHASGTGTTAEAIGDTALVTDSGVARVSGTQTNPSANLYRTVATMNYVSGLAITEHGIFSAVTTGTLWDRSVFSAINVISGDSITFTYTLTLTAGG